MFLFLAEESFSTLVLREEIATSVLVGSTAYFGAVGTSAWLISNLTGNVSGGTGGAALLTKEVSASVWMLLTALFLAFVALAFAIKDVAISASGSGVFAASLTKESLAGEWELITALGSTVRVAGTRHFTSFALAHATGRAFVFRVPGRASGCLNGRTLLLRLAAELSTGVSKAHGILLLIDGKELFATTGFTVPECLTGVFLATFRLAIRTFVRFHVGNLASRVLAFTLGEE